MNNDICEIQFTPQLSRLDILDLSGNSLTEIPNLFNVSSRLSKLIISKNNISEVGILPVMTNLQVINLDCHSLFEFPDLTDMLSSLLNLFTEENPYTKIKMSVILKS